MAGGGVKGVFSCEGTDEFGLGITEIEVQNRTFTQPACIKTSLETHVPGAWRIPIAEQVEL